MNPWHNVRLMHAAANAFFALTLAGVLCTACWWLVHRPYFDLRSVSIEAREETEMRNVSTPLLRQAAARVSGNFFTVDLNAVRHHFEALPWVRRATARRIWPDRLVVTLEEHLPVAQWGESRLINTYGEVFSANVAEAEEGGPLPELSGPTGTHGVVAARWDELRKWLSPIGREPRALQLSPRHAWTARLDDGTVLLIGRDQNLSAELRVTRWVQAYPRVQARLNSPVEAIDLRYPNGFAVRPVAMAPGQDPLKTPVQGHEPGAAGSVLTPGAAGSSARSAAPGRDANAASVKVGHPQ